MSIRIVQLVLALLLCSAALPNSYAQSAVDQDAVASLARGLAERVVAGNEERPRVTVLDFTDIQNRPNELGRYLALELANELVLLRDVAVLDRANLETIMAEHQLTAEGLLRPEDAKKLGQFAGVDAILIGNLSLIGERFELFVRSISTETSEIVASGKASISATDDLRRMHGSKVNARAQGAASPDGALTEGEAITSREVGPITAILRNVAEHSVQSGRKTTPAIRCTFDVENRNLDRCVAIAANQRAKEGAHGLTAEGYRGDLVDSNGVRWTLADVRGISAVLCFEAEERFFRVTQSNPGAIANYIRTARRYDYESNLLDSDQRARFWSGSFTAIQPGETIRVTLDFVPVASDDRRDRSGPPLGSRPTAFELDLELVLATHLEGDDPVKAKDLKMRNLTVDRVALPGRASGSAP